MTRSLFKFFSLCLLVFLAGCASNNTIVNSVDEREANEIVVFLASKGIEAQKILAPSTAIGGGSNAIDMYSISVATEKATDAMAILGRYGLPRPRGTNLLTLFAPQGLMSSTREETIRYQAGLAEELKNTIRKIDGVIDADVQISFPDTTITPLPGTIPPKVTAAVFIKHQGMLEDPNSHMEVKIKRLMAGSVSNLDYNNVSVISDRARFADVMVDMQGEMVGMKAMQQTYVSIWGLVMTKSSLARFRFIFFLLIFLLLLLSAATGWMVYKFYPQLRLRKKVELPSGTGDVEQM
jgi:type III secretion protein J